MQLSEEDIKTSPDEFNDENIIDNQSDPNFVLENSDQSKFDCSKCDESFKKILNLVKHFNKKHKSESDKYICPKCPKKQFKA